MLHATTACTFVVAVAFVSKFIKADLRIAIKDYRRNKNLRIQLTQVRFSYRRFKSADMSAHSKLNPMQAWLRNACTVSDFPAGGHADFGDEFERRRHFVARKLAAAES